MHRWQRWIRRRRESLADKAAVGHSPEEPVDLGKGALGSALAICGGNVGDRTAPGGDTGTGAHQTASPAPTGSPAGGVPTGLPHVRADRIDAYELERGLAAVTGKTLRRSPCSSPHDSPRSFPRGCDTDLDPDRLLVAKSQSCIAGEVCSGSYQSTSTDLTAPDADKPVGGVVPVSSSSGGGPGDAENLSMRTRRQPAVCPASSSGVKAFVPEGMGLQSPRTSAPCSHAFDMYATRVLFEACNERERDTERRLLEALRSPLGGSRPLQGMTALHWGTPPTPPLVAAPPPPAASAMARTGTGELAAVPSPCVRPCGAGCNNVGPEASSLQDARGAAYLSEQPLAGAVMHIALRDGAEWARPHGVSMGQALGAGAGAISARDLLMGRAPRVRSRAPSNNAHHPPQQQQPPPPPQQQQQQQQRPHQQQHLGPQFLHRGPPSTPARSIQAGQVANPTPDVTDPAVAATEPATTNTVLRTPTDSATKDAEAPPVVAKASPVVYPAVDALMASPSSAFAKSLPGINVSDLETAYSAAPSLSHMLGADPLAGNSEDVSTLAAEAQQVSPHFSQASTEVLRRTSVETVTVAPVRPPSERGHAKQASELHRSSGETAWLLGTSRRADDAKTPRLSLPQQSSQLAPVTPDRDCKASGAAPTHQHASKGASELRSRGSEGHCGFRRRGSLESETSAHEPDFNADELRSFFWRPRRRGRSRRPSDRLQERSGVLGEGDAELSDGHGGARAPSYFHPSMHISREGVAYEPAIGGAAGARTPAIMQPYPHRTAAGAGRRSFEEGRVAACSPALRRRSLQELRGASAVRPEPACAEAEGDKLLHCPTGGRCDGHGPAQPVVTSDAPARPPEAVNRFQMQRTPQSRSSVVPSPLSSTDSSGNSAATAAVATAAAAVAGGSSCDPDPSTGVHHGRKSVGDRQRQIDAGGGDRGSQVNGPVIASYVSAPAFLRSCSVQTGTPPLRAVATLLACLSESRDDHEDVSGADRQEHCAQSREPYEREGCLFGAVCNIEQNREVEATAKVEGPPASHAAAAAAAAVAVMASSSSFRTGSGRAPKQLLLQIREDDALRGNRGTACTAALVDGRRLSALRQQWQQIRTAAAANQRGALGLSSTGGGSCGTAGGTGEGIGSTSCEGRGRGVSCAWSDGGDATAGVTAALAATSGTEDTPMIFCSSTTWALAAATALGNEALGGGTGHGAAPGAGAGRPVGLQWLRREDNAGGQPQQAMQPRRWPASGAAGPEGPLARNVAERLMTRNPLFRGGREDGHSSYTDEAESSRDEGEEY